MFSCSNDPKLLLNELRAEQIECLIKALENTANISRLVIF